jgi:glucan phosphoethanolaminetransferase (alkaline phosphatase superfamily)
MDNSSSKPVGIRIITILLLSASMGFGFLGTVFFALGAVGGAGMHPSSIPADALWLIVFSFLFAFLTFFGFILLAANRQPTKGNWYFLIALWLSMVAFFGWALFTDNPYNSGEPNLPVFVGINLVCVVYSLVCTLYFQTTPVKEYFNMAKTKTEAGKT